MRKKLIKWSVVVCMVAGPSAVFALEAAGKAGCFPCGNQLGGDG